MRINLGTQFSLELKILIFWTKSAGKGNFHCKTEKANTTMEFWIVELITKLQLKLTILNFWTKFVQKGYFRSKTVKVN